MRALAGIDWCRDVDYGNFPQWVAIILGAIVGGFTIFGIMTARSAYVDDVRTRTFAQARLVYGEIAEDIRLDKTDDQVVVHLTDPKAQRIRFESAKRGNDKLVAEYEDSGPKDILVRANERVRIYVLRIHNSSDELITKVNARVADKDRRNEIGGKIGGVILGPRSTAEWVLTMPEATAFEPHEVTVTFTDATGKSWVRRGGRPVETFPPKAKKPLTRFKDPAKARRRLHKSASSNG